MSLVHEYWTKSIFILTQWFMHSNIQKLSMQVNSSALLLYQRTSRRDWESKGISYGWINSSPDILFLYNISLVFDGHKSLKDKLSIYTLRSQRKKRFLHINIIQHFYPSIFFFFLNISCVKLKSGKPSLREPVRCPSVCRLRPQSRSWFESTIGREAEYNGGGYRRFFC